MRKEKYLGMVLYIDPPWRYDFEVSGTRKIENQYPTMSLEEIKNYNIPTYYKDVVAFIWTTAPKLKESLEVIDAWGFEYKTCAVWDKVNIGMGYWFRGRHELLLVATKGNVYVPDGEDRVPSIFVEKRTKHSAKPVYFRNLIDKWYPDAEKIELFARTRGKDWKTVGNENISVVYNWEYKTEGDIENLEEFGFKKEKKE